MARRPLDPERIASAALALADAEGLEAITARSLAERLQVSPMALYRHVDGIPSLVEGLFEHVLATSPILDHATPGVEAWLGETFRRIHACLVAHPAVLPLLGTPAGYGPRALAVVDAVLGRLAADGRAPADAVRIFHALLSYTIGAASVEATMRRAARAEPRRGFTAFDGLPHVRAALPELARFGASQTFREGLALVVRTSLGDQTV